MPDVNNPQGAGPDGPGPITAPTPIDGATGLPRPDGQPSGQPFVGEDLERAKELDREAGRTHTSEQPESEG